MSDHERKRKRRPATGHGLVLSRKVGERIYIGENAKIVLEVTHIDLRRRVVKLGFVCDKSVRIMRDNYEPL